MSVTEADPPQLAAREEPAEPPRPRWQVWRSPAGQPRWARPALLAVAAVAAVLFAWNLPDAGYATFYSVAVKSMSVSWKAFFYGALDPGATITIDKLAGSFLPQALSARIFGYHQWSLALPQVIEGIVATLVMYRVVRRWSGEVAGLLAAGLLALTPVVTSMFGHAMEDGALTMCLVLAVDAYQRAVNHARLRSLLLAGVWVGVGFQCKMLQAWMIVPALAIGYLVLAPTSWKRRLVHLLAAGAVLVAVSFSWVMLYTVTPAADRPYVDGSTNNSAFAMVVGYNGLERFGIDVPGSVAAMGSGGGGPRQRLSSAQREELQEEFGVTGQNGPTAQSGQTGRSGQDGQAAPRNFRPGGGGGPGGGGRFGSNWLKLLGSQYATQTGWLYPVALAGLVLGLWWLRRSPRTDRLRGGYLMWGLWLVTVAAVLSRISIPHTAYLASLSVPVAALAGGGTVLLWRAYRAGGARAWALPVVVAVETVWTVYLSWGYSDFLPWLIPVVGMVGLAAVLVLALGLVNPAVRGRVVTAGLVGGVAAMLLTPTAWAASVLDSAYAGSAFNAGAGPSGAQGFGPGGGNRQTLFAGPTGRQGTGPGLQGGGTREAPQRGFGMGSGGPGSSDGTLTADQRKLLDYTLAHGDGATYVFAVSSWSEAGPYIQATGAKVMPMGGFSGSVPEPTLAQAKKLVAGGKLRFFLVGGGGGFGGFLGRGGGSGSVSQITDWVRKTCEAVPASDYGASTDLSLYQCSKS